MDHMLDDPIIKEVFYSSHASIIFQHLANEGDMRWNVALNVCFPMMAQATLVLGNTEAEIDASECEKRAAEIFEVHHCFVERHLNQLQNGVRRLTKTMIIYSLMTSYRATCDPYHGRPLSCGAAPS